MWDLRGGLTADSPLVKPHRLSGSFLSWRIPETELMRNAESSDNEVKLLEKIDDTIDGAINSCSFNKNGILATGSGYLCIHSFRFSTIYISRDKLIRLFQVQEENNNVEEISWSPLESHTYPVNHVEFSQSGTKLASCSLDGCTNIWDSQTGDKIVTLPRNDLSVKVCRFAPNGQLFITAGDDEKAAVWDLNSLEQIALVILVF